MDSNKLQFISSSFFDLSIDFPNQIFKNQENLNCYCYQEELLTQYSNRNLFSKKLKELQLLLNSSDVYYYVEGYEEQPCYEKVFSVSDIKDNELYHYDALSNKEADDMWVWRKNIYISDESQKWGCILATKLEWIIFGVQQNIQKQFEDVFLKDNQLNVFKYKNTHDAIRFNYPTGIATKAYQKKLEENYFFK